MNIQRGGKLSVLDYVILAAVIYFIGSGIYMLLR